MKRRDVLKNLGLSLTSIPLLSSGLGPSDWQPFEAILEWKGSFAEDKTKDESFWKDFKRQFYAVSDDFINLENGYFGVPPVPVNTAYHQFIDILNSQSSRYARTEFGGELKKIIKILSDFAGADGSELLITRNATEAMNIVITGMPWNKGDEVILTGQDYPSFIETFQMLAKRDGITIKKIEIPYHPKSDEGIVALYAAAITPPTRCILLTHLIHQTGQIMPVKKIAAMAKSRGVETMVDAAHSFAQLDYKIPDLGCDFVGVNLHKWFSNPLGVGLLYVKKERIKDLKPMFGDATHQEDDIMKLGHFGTLAFPTLLTIPIAAEYNAMVTIPVKEARLRYLQQYWTTQARKINRIDMLTPAEATRSCALATFRVDGMKAKDIVNFLYDKYQVFSVARYWENVEAVRITPNLYNATRDVDRLLEGLQGLSKL